MDAQHKPHQVIKLIEKYKHLAILGYLLTALMLITFQVGILGETLFVKDYGAEHVITSFALNVLLLIVIGFESIRAIKYQEVALPTLIHKYLGILGVVAFFVLGMFIFIDCIAGYIKLTLSSFAYSPASKIASMQSYIPYLVLLAAIEFVCVRRAAFSHSIDAKENIIYETLMQIRGAFARHFPKLIALIVMLFVLSQSVHFVPELHYSVKLSMGKVVLDKPKRFSNEVAARVYKPGLHFKLPFIHEFIDVSHMFNVNNSIKLEDETTIKVRAYFRVKSDKIWELARATGGDKATVESMVGIKLRRFLNETVVIAEHKDEETIKNLIKEFFENPIIEREHAMFELPDDSFALKVDINP